MENETDNINSGSGISTRDKELFYKLIIMLRVGVYDQLGLIENPFTKEKRKKIKVARESIDMLDMLLRRMRLSKEEDDALRSILSELQTLFVKESTGSGTSTGGGTSATES